MAELAGAAESAEPIDVVYTWVDDSWPGYIEQLNQFAAIRHDLNRNRTRDNLDLLRYSFRSLGLYMPWIRNVYLFSMRPQVPPWLDADHPRIRVVHHDEVMAADILPTFNSFAILCHLHLLEGLSEKFIYICDDFLLGAPIASVDLMGDGESDPMYFEHRYAPAPALMDSDKKSPWDACRAYTNKLMNETFGENKRLDVAHMPALFRRSVWAEMIKRWPDDFDRTRRSRFRAKYNVVPEFLYPHYLIARGLGHAAPQEVSARSTHYVEINNIDIKARYDTWRLKRTHAKFYALNDDFGDNPNPSVVRRWRDCLEALLPDTCIFER